MKIFVLSIILLMILYPSMSQFQVSNRNNALNNPNFDKPGKYEVVPILNRYEIDPGDSLQAQIFITGYGKIGGSKLAMYSSTKNIFENSNILYDIGSVGIDHKAYYFGTNSYPFTNIVILTLNGGLEFNKNDSITITNYFDINPDPNDFTISTETMLTNAPITINLHTVKYINPGTYKIFFNYTYFNGQEWSSSSGVSEFKVSSWVDRNSTLLWWVGSIIGFVSLIPLIISGVKAIKNLLLKLFRMTLRVYP